ncbi:hypothetical protein WOC76_01740 [Methylocystis sp. IM3]|uniref:hypothetical protein n=1 Tax=unclassified Methylocystis TaxID=2625913 RepID=UPI0030FD01AD
MYLVSSYNGLGVRHLSAGFATQESVFAFLRARIAELAQSGSYYIVVTEQGCLDQRIYLTSLLLERIETTDWSEAVIGPD